MEKTVPERLVEVAIGLLGTGGAGAVTVRAVEAAAGVPHGSVRHHFGSLAGLRLALVRGLLLAERADRDDTSLPDLVAFWTGEGAPITRLPWRVVSRRSFSTTTRSGRTTSPGASSTFG